MILRLLRRHADLLLVILVFFGIDGAGFIMNYNSVQRINQLQQGQILQDRSVEYKLCHSLDALSKIEPPDSNMPGEQAVVAYRQALHDALAQLGPDLGCK